MLKNSQKLRTAEIWTFVISDFDIYVFSQFFDLFKLKKISNLIIISPFENIGANKQGS